MSETIKLTHGAGGALTRKLLRNYFLRYLNCPELERLEPAVVLNIPAPKIAFTCGNFVVKPLFFPGGDIGRLAICATTNELAVKGAEPKFISAGFTIEEGLPLEDLEKVLKSMAKVAFECGVKVVCSDVKVVENGKGDGIYLNLAGVGVMNDQFCEEAITEGDKVIISGTVGDHELAVTMARRNLSSMPGIISDCTPLNCLIRNLFSQVKGIKAMGYPSQGGLATLLCKLVEFNTFGIRIEEIKVPLSEKAKEFCQLWGLDPLYLANQGRVVLVSRAEDAELIVQIMKKQASGEKAAIIGSVNEDIPGRVILQTEGGVEKILEMREGEWSVRVT